MFDKATWAAAATAFLLVTAAPTAGAAEPIVPSWIKWDAGKAQAEIWIKAAYNGNNGSWNYNGYYEGGVTIVVPAGTRVVIHFENPDGNYPHSLLVTEPYPKDALPDIAGRDQVAISRAYTRSPEKGCHSCKEDLRFKARTPGSYYLYCGVVGHGQAGMWIGFEISEAADTAHARIAKGAVAPDDQPPWQ
jgi:hypothetical protein